jgi:hypothetical protein
MKNNIAAGIIRPLWSVNPEASVGPFFGKFAKNKELPGDTLHAIAD